MQRTKAVLSAICLLAGVVCMAWGYNAYQASRTSLQAPPEVSCRDLLAHAPGQDPRLCLTQYVLRDEGFVAQGGDGKSHWDRVVIPVSTAQDDGIPDSSLRLILITDRVHNDAQIIELQAAQHLPGTLVSSASRLDPETQAILAETYPDTDFQNCLLLEHERPAQPGHVTWGVLLLGVAIAGLGVFLRVRLPEPTRQRAPELVPTP